MEEAVKPGLPRICFGLDSVRAARVGFSDGRRSETAEPARADGPAYTPGITDCVAGFSGSDGMAPAIMPVMPPSQRHLPKN